MRARRGRTDRPPSCCTEGELVQKCFTQKGSQVILRQQCHHFLTAGVTARAVSGRTQVTATWSQRSPESVVANLLNALLCPFEMVVGKWACDTMTLSFKGASSRINANGSDLLCAVKRQNKILLTTTGTLPCHGVSSYGGSRRVQRVRQSSPPQLQMWRVILIHTSHTLEHKRCI